MKESVPNALTPSEWLVNNIPAGSSVAFDPKLYAYCKIDFVFFFFFFLLILVLFVTCL